MAMARNITLPVLSIVFLSAPAWGQEGPQIVGDLGSLNAKKLTAEELRQLMPGAGVTRLTASGNTHKWTNGSDGTFIVSSDNRTPSGGTGITGGRPSTAPGKWHIADDGRYCVLIEWRTAPTEEWCRYFFVTPDGTYYATKSDATPTEKLYKFQVSK